MAKRKFKKGERVAILCPTIEGGVEVEGYAVVLGPGSIANRYRVHFEDGYKDERFIDAAAQDDPERYAMELNRELEPKS